MRALAVPVPVAALVVTAVAGCGGGDGSGTLKLTSTCEQYRQASQSAQDRFAQDQVNAHSNVSVGVTGAEQVLAEQCGRNIDQPLATAVKPLFSPTAATPAPTAPPQDCATSESVRTALRGYVEDLLSYDYNDLDSYLPKLRDESTSSFYKEIATTFSSVRALAGKYHPVSHASVTSVSFESGDCSAPTFVATATQTVSNTQVKGPRRDRVTVRVTLSWAPDGTYKVAKLTTL